VKDSIKSGRYNKFGYNIDWLDLMYIECMITNTLQISGIENR